MFSKGTAGFLKAFGINRIHKCVENSSRNHIFGSMKRFKSFGINKKDEPDVGRWRAVKRGGEVYASGA
jgi:hypothetical protein